MKLEIGVAKEHDLPSLEALLAAQLAEHRISIAIEALRAAIQAPLIDPRWGVFLVARIDGVVVGVAWLSTIWSIEHGGRSAWLDELYVIPPLRGAGIGTKLLEAVLDWARIDGLVAIDLEVEEDHARVEALYERHGFRPHTRRRWVKRVRSSEN
jgi:GNAT superfamily N-acetyltransferase